MPLITTTTMRCKMWLGRTDGLTNGSYLRTIGRAGDGWHAGQWDVFPVLTHASGAGLSHAGPAPRVLRRRCKYRYYSIGKRTFLVLVGVGRVTANSQPPAHECVNLHTSQSYQTCVLCRAHQPRMSYIAVVSSSFTSVLWSHHHHALSPCTTTNMMASPPP